MSMAELQDLQHELDRRTAVEHEAMELMQQCQFDEAVKLLDSLDDSKLVT